MFKHIDLFAGIGGFSLAFESEGFKTVAFSEINPDKCLVYEHHFPNVPNLGDIKTITRNEIGRVDVLTGGVPCQPASALGHMRGSLDERWLWPEALRMVSLFRPRFAVFENPPSLLVLEGGRAWNGIVSGLVARGYDCWWDVFPAAAFGAGHLRERVFLVASDADNQHGRDRAGRGNGAQADYDSGSTIANPYRAGLQGHAGHGADCHGRAQTRRPVATPDLRGTFADAKGELRLSKPAHQSPPDLRGRADGENWWHEINTGVPVLAHGLPARLVEAAARCAGDAVVPQAVRPIARAIYQQLNHVQTL
ncbi:MAG: DNA (cytosine-5-)-methyltransferase [Verrucomicrobiales bacterium]|nr:MAG: DNA (cytosine-5-)-methyltransferase [Verrucomicrobiales bacterium]